MSQLRESRRKNDFKYYIELPSPNITQVRSAVKGEDRPAPRRSDAIKLAIALTGIIGGLYGLWLLWASL